MFSAYAFTPGTSERYNFWATVVGESSTIFKVKACNNAYILLSYVISSDNSVRKAVEVIIGTTGNNIVLKYYLFTMAPRAKWKSNTFQVVL